MKTSVRFCPGIQRNTNSDAALLGMGGLPSPFPLFWWLPGAEAASSPAPRPRLMLQFTHQNSFHTLLPTILCKRNTHTSSLPLLANRGAAFPHCPSKPLLLVQLAKKNRMFWSSRSEAAGSKPAFFSRCRPQRNGCRMQDFDQRARHKTASSAK